MANSDTEVAIIGGGAAGVAAAHRLHGAGVAYLIVEARTRLGGRALTSTERGFAMDLGCGWLHSAERNPWSEIAQRQGRTIDKTPPPWERPSLEIGFPLAEQREYRQAQREFDERLDEAMQHDGDSPASAYLEPGCRWNALLNAVSTYYSGAELDRISARDLAKYREDNMNWRVTEGLGTTVEAYGAGLPVVLDCPVRRIDHTGKRLGIDTAKGTIAADHAIVTLPTAALTEPGLFSPALPQKIEAAAGLPLGFADKLFLSLERRGGIRIQQPPLRPHRPHGDRLLSSAAFRAACHRMLLRRRSGVAAGGGRRPRVLRIRSVRALRPARQHVPTPHQADRPASLGRRPVRARLLLLRVAGQGGLPRRSCRAGRRPAVLCRRGLFACRFFHRARRVRNRRRRRRRNHREAAMTVQEQSYQYRAISSFTQSGSRMAPRGAKPEI